MATHDFQGHSESLNNTVLGVLDGFMTIRRLIDGVHVNNLKLQGNGNRNAHHLKLLKLK